MSFDDYAINIAQKYRLAISIAVLKTKPKNLTTDDYIEQLRVTIEKQGDDFDISACSDDFRNHDSLEIINDHNHNENKSLHNENLRKHGFNEDIDKQIRGFDVNDVVTPVNDEVNKFNGEVTRINTAYNGNLTKNGCDDEVSEIIRDAAVNDVETTINGAESQINGMKTPINEQETSHTGTNITILHNFVDNTERTDETKRREKLREMINVLKGVDDITKIFNSNTNLTEYKTQDYAETSNLDISTKDMAYAERNQTQPQNLRHDTALESVKETDIHNLKNNTKDEVQKDKEIDLCDTKIRNELKRRTAAKSRITNTKIAKFEDFNKATEFNNAFGFNKETEFNKATESNNATELNTPKLYNDTNHKNNVQPKDQIDTQDLYNAEFNTHYSQSQINELVVDNMFIHGNKTNQNPNKNRYKDKQFNVSNQDLLNNRSNIENDTAFSLNGHTLDAFQNNENQMRGNVIENDTVIHKNDNTTQKYAQINLNAYETNIGHSLKGCTVFDETEVDSENDKAGTEEIIPFKVIEEMNNIKNYLKRNSSQILTQSTQIKSSYTSGYQSQCTSIGQSATCVFSYLTTCSLVSSTYELMEQISEVLGQLIDTLHEDEVYPIFLEELIETIDKSLAFVHEEHNYIYDVLLKKDEQIQRTLLLTKSTHIQRITIGKINIVLQKLLDETSADNTYEIKNIDKVEGLCYIFQILQEILSKYCKTNYSQNSTQSDDGVLRKRDIADIWRTKWLPNTKNTSNEDSYENKCVMKECSAILNKIIVDLMDGYSLIAFSALKCFNLLQV